MTIQAIRDLQDGVIGRVYCASGSYAILRDSIGKGRLVDVPPHLDYELWQGPAPRRPYVDNRIHYNWHWLWHWGNGELGNNGVHILDLCRWGLRVDYPIRVTSSGGRYRFDDDQQTPDTHMVGFEFDNETAITWRGLSCNRHGSNFVTFYGENGTLELDSNGAHVICDAHDKEVKRVLGGSIGDSEHYANFLSAIRNDNPLNLNAEIEQGHISTLLCHLGNIAQRTGNSLKCRASDGLNILGTSYGDATLDGAVDATDFSSWSVNRFQTGTGWATADFNGDGLTDVRDFNVWNKNKFLAPPIVLDEPVLSTLREPRVAGAVRFDYEVVVADTARVDLIFAENVNTETQHVIQKGMDESRFKIPRSKQITIETQPWCEVAGCRQANGRRFSLMGARKRDVTLDRDSEHREDYARNLSLAETAGRRRRLDHYRQPRRSLEANAVDAVMLQEAGDWDSPSEADDLDSQ